MTALLTRRSEGPLGPASRTSGGPSHTGPSISRFAAGLVGLFVLTTVGWMGLWAVVTAGMYGAAPVVVSSGSMAPALDVGDLVVVEPFHGQRIHKGSVVVFDDPVAGRSIIHRVVEVGDGGTFTTRGDANAAVDSTPLELADVDASGRFLLPRLGLPVVWAQQGQWHLVVLVLCGLAFAVWLARFALFDGYDPWLAGAVPDPGTAPLLRERLRDAMARGQATVGEIGVPRGLAHLARRRVAEVGAVMLALVFAHATVTAYAAFADTTGNGLNQFAAGSLQSPASFSVTPGTCVGAATIAVRATSSASINAGAQIVIAAPGGVQAGDVMLAAISWHTHDYSGSGIDPPAGWTEVRIDDDGTHILQGIFWKEATASEPATYTFLNGTTDITRQVVGGIVAYSGVDTSTPIDAHGAFTTSSNVFSLTAPSVIATVAGSRLVSVFGQHDAGVLSVPSGMTGRYAESVGSGGGVATATYADQVLGAAGATGTRTSTGSGNGSGVAQSIVLDPAGGLNAANLSWAPSGSSFVDGYLLQRYIGAILDNEWLITPGTASAVVDFGGLVAGTNYTYRLRATAGEWRSTPVSLGYTPAAC